MDRQTADYAQEFDESVAKYNEWLASLENPKAQKRNAMSAFFIGLGAVLDIFGNSSGTQTFRHNGPAYSRTDLSSGQKNAIALASDWQRVDLTLDKILLGVSSNEHISIEDAEAWKPVVQQMYNHLRDFYVSSVMR
ncbi:hypothetical protein GOV11_03675 [Candidatus Woesearchaeota archaeon]|nr:hypothetical protein [Candidatus Woesearchaeota archaeon]